MKKSVKWLMNKYELAEELVNLKGRLIEIIQSEDQTEKRSK